MLEYDRIDILEGIDIKKRNASKECKICHYWYFIHDAISIMNNSKLIDKMGVL